MNNTYCPIIHGGLTVDIKNNSKILVRSCCLRNDPTEQTDIWNNQRFKNLRAANLESKWDQGCAQCERNENAGLESFRTGMTKALGVKTNLSGPSRLDLMFDISCNLACRTCGPAVSTFWQTHLKTHNIPFTSNKAIDKSDQMIDILKTLDLSNLKMVVFCGGETLLGSSHWKVAEYLVNYAPVQNITLCFQTNGTQPISEKYYKIIEKFKLVKLHLSLDGIENQFEYLRWPAKWDATVKNIFSLNNEIPVNTMFLVEETISILNWFYSYRLEKWLIKNFSHNRLGDPVVHSRHLANGIYSLDAVNQEYIDAMKNNKLFNLLSNNFKHNNTKIQSFMSEVKKFDNIRGQDWTKIFPEIAKFYKK